MTSTGLIPPRSRRQIHIPGRARYPVWSIRSITLIAVIALAISAALVFGISRGSVFHELELTLAIVAASLFLFLTVGLYRGVRVRKRDARPEPFKSPELRDWADVTPDTVPDCPLDAVGGDAGCLGAIAGLVLSIVAAVALWLLLWLLLNVALGAFFVLTLALYWLFHLALRQVFARSRTSRGRLAPSVGYAALYTFLYTGWLFALLFMSARYLQH